MEEEDLLMFYLLLIFKEDVLLKIIVKFMRSFYINWKKFIDKKVSDFFDFGIIVESKVYIFEFLIRYKKGCLVRLIS